MEIREVIEVLENKFGVTGTHIAKSLGITDNYYYMIRRGDKKGSEKIRVKINNFFNKYYKVDEVI